MRRTLALLLPFIILLLAFRFGQEHKVSGIVSDEKGNPISNVSVQVKSSSTGTLTDKKGNYAITVSNDKAVLVFSVVGYNNKEVPVKSQVTINVKLTAAEQALNEVVVVGYGANYDMSDRAVAAPMTKSIHLQGRAAGISIQGTAGLYGSRSPAFNTEDYDNITENGFRKVTDDPLSTFSIDVDAASYSNIRRYLNNDQLPPAGAVRIEEMINYFRYDYARPKDNHPFSISTEMSNCPWNKQHKLVMIGLQGKKIPMENLPSSNLVFLVDVSGSMQGPGRLGLVKSSLKLLVDQLREEDRISIVVYAGAAGQVLAPTSGANKTKIKDAIDALEAGGSTAGGEGIKLAYKVANEQFRKGGNNRVILCTDGDFNVGASSDDALERMIEKERESGVFLTVLGYGMGNYKDNKMQKLADKGNGNHAYIDGISEAKKVLVNEFGGTLFTIAKDVKLQVEFNPAKVAGYRLIGYENRLLNKEDFNDDKKDAGELGSGHTVTALYEIIPAGVKSSFLKAVDPLKYQKENPAVTNDNKELLTVKFRYKQPDGNTSQLITHPVIDQNASFQKTSEHFRFATAVAGFGMLLRNSEFKGETNYAQIIQIARQAKGTDAEGYRSEFIKLVRKAATLSDSEVDEDVAVRE
jgi:Ca-activated chloride channel family protein